MTENTEDTATNTKSDTPAKSRGRRRRRPQAWTIDQFVVEPVEGKARFHDLDLPLSLMRGIADLGFEYCTPIQAESLPHALDGHDVVGKAQTGTGKTAAFLLNIITDLINHPIEGERFVGEARSMILAPTRELALQIAEDAVQLTRHTGLNVHALVGGMDYAKQLKHMETRHCDILVGTPGRLLDFANNRDVHLDQVEVLVIDEADRMLDMGFIPQVRRLVRLTPRNNERQTMLFSATFTPEVMRLSEQWTDSPVRIEIGAERVATDTVEQKIYITTSGEKFSLLNAILKGDNVQSVMVFANRRDICRRLHEKLGKKGFKVGLLSGDVPQTRRMKTLEAFKNGSIKVMVATDVAGRGIHVDGVSHVINYTLPEEPEDYVHRIGRTGRAGETGTSISFACEDDAVLLEPIEKLLGQKLPCTMPDEVFVKTPKAPKPDKEPSAALNEKQEPSAALKEKQEPSAALNEKQEPSAALNEKQEPSAALKENQEPSAALKEKQEPSAALKENQEPSAALKEKQEPSASPNENQEPSAALKEKQEPSASPNEKQEPSAALEEKQEPSAALNEKQEPLAALKEKQEPLAALNENQEPSAALKEKQEPLAAINEKQEPSAALNEKQEPSAALEEKQEPLAALKEKQEPLAEDRQPPAQ